MYIYYRENGDIVMRSEKKIDTHLPFKEITPTEEEETKFKENWIPKVERGKVKFEKPEHIKKKERLSVEDLKVMTGKAKTVNELKDIIQLLLDK